MSLSFFLSGIPTAYTQGLVMLVVLICSLSKLCEPPAMRVTATFGNQMMGCHQNPSTSCKCRATSQATAKMSINRAHMIISQLLQQLIVFSLV